MCMQILTLRGALSARRAAPPPASSAPLAASSPCLLRVPRSLRHRRPRSLKASALLEQGIKEVAGGLSPSGTSSKAEVLSSAARPATAIMASLSSYWLRKSMCGLAAITFMKFDDCWPLLSSSKGCSCERQLTILE